MTTFRIMSLNLFYGGTTMNLTTRKKSEPLYSHPETLDRVAEIIQNANVDAVGLQETDGNTPVLAKKLGWYYSLKFNIISKFYLWESNTLPCVCVEIESNRIVWVANIHALSDPYGPDLVQNGSRLEKVLDIETNFRLPPIAIQINQLVVAQNRSGSPLFLTGDFNSPSSLDWTTEACRKRNLPYSVQWPLSNAFLSMGFKDSYRNVYPCPIKNSGITWFIDGPESNLNGIEDRIDWILYRGEAQVLNSWTIGGNELCDIVSKPWPSDHCAVVSEFLVYPTCFPVNNLFISTHEDQVQIRSPTNIQIWKNNKKIKFIYSVSVDEIHSIVLDSGKYFFRNLYHSINFTIHSQPEIRVIHSESSFISVYISGSSGMQMDWIRIRKVGSNVISIYVYTKAIYEGLVEIKPPFYNEENRPEWPLSLGEYYCCLLEDGGYKVLATTRFVIK